MICGLPSFFLLPYTRSSYNQGGLRVAQNIYLRVAR